MDFLHSSYGEARPTNLRMLASPPFAGLSSCLEKRRWRVALYSHDTMGLGHKRRNLLIAQALRLSGLSVDVLMISGMQDGSVQMMEGIDYLALPALYKDAEGHYRSRHLGLPLAEMIGLRSQLIRTAIKGFQPDVFIVDNVPRGAEQELDPVLEYTKSQPHIRCVLGLRDVLDTPVTVMRDWKRADNEAAIHHYYDAVWIYGDPAIYDLRQEYPFSAELIGKMRPLGYLDQRFRVSQIRPNLHSQLSSLSLPPGDMVLCLVGGGQDGAALATAFAQSMFPAGTTGVILTGPFMPLEVRQSLHRWAMANPQLRVAEYFEEPTLLLERADRVIAMGGYNTTCEILSFQKPALLVPRIMPRQEQWIRAERLQQRELVDVLHPTDMNPAALTEWLHRPLVPRPSSVNLDGLDNLLIELQRLFITSSSVSASQAS